MLLAASKKEPLDEMVYHLRIIKLIKESISVPLTNLVNLSFEQGVFPSELKLAIITPLYKAKDAMLTTTALSFISVL